MRSPSSVAADRLSRSLRSRLDRRHCDGGDGRRPGRTLWVSGGVVAGVLAPVWSRCLPAACRNCSAATARKSSTPRSRLCRLMLTWHNVWMARHGREMAAELRAAGEAVAAGSKSLAALGIVVAIAVLREGSEVVLFLYGVAAAQGGASFAMVIGGFIGLVLGSLVCLATYLGLITIPDALSVRRDQRADRALAAGWRRRRSPSSNRPTSSPRSTRRCGIRPGFSDFSLSRPRAAHADRLCRSADRDAARRLCRDARDHRRADEVVFFAARGGRMLRLPNDGSGDGRTAGEVIGTDLGGENLAEVGKFRLKAFDVETNHAAARERQRDAPCRKSRSANSTASRLSSAFLFDGSTPRHLQASTRSKRNAVRQRR